MKSQKVYIVTRGELPSLGRGSLTWTVLCESMLRRSDLEGHAKELIQL